MPAADANLRDSSRIQRMLDYCRQISGSLSEINNSKELFMHSHTYQNAVAMCILQIGELAKQLTEEFRDSHSHIPWNLIARTRDLYAHHYGMIDFEMVWETAINDIPEIEDFCAHYISE